MQGQDPQRTGSGNRGQNPGRRIHQRPDGQYTVRRYEISVIGEVARPGQYDITNDRISLLDALSLAGDLTIYGVRSDVKVIREENGVRTTASLDLTSQDIYDSPYFYLQQNDVIYVKPNKYRAQAGEISQNRSFYISLVSTAVSVATLIVTLTR